MLQASADHWLGDQTAFEALVRFTDEELKHQEMFRRMEALSASGMAPGYIFLPQPNDVAKVVLGKHSWAVLALICHIELFVLAHYREAIEPDPQLSALWKDVFTFHAREESQHAIVDELEWKREDAKLSPGERDAAVDDLIALVGAVDGIVQMQAQADSTYFLSVCRGDGDRPHHAGRLPLAIHRLRGPGRALPADPRRHGERSADAAHRRRARTHHREPLSP
jgi:hypothetical protein